MRQRASADNLTICYDIVKKQIDVSSLRIHSYFDNVMTKFMINTRIDAWQTDVNLSNSPRIKLIVYIPKLSLTGLKADIKTKGQISHPCWLVAAPITPSTHNHPCPRFWPVE